MRVTPYCWLICSLFTVWSFAVEHNSVFTLEDSFKLRHVVRAKIAPNAKQIAFTLTLPRQVGIDKDGGNWQQLYVIDRKGDTRPFLTGRNSIGQFNWSADGEHIWFLSDLSDNNIWDIYRIAESGGSYQRVYRHRAHIAGFSIDDENRYLIFWARQSDKNQFKQLEQGFSSQVYLEDKPKRVLWLVDLNAPETGSKIIFDKHVLAAEFLPDSQKILVKHSDSAQVEDSLLSSKLSVLDAQGKQLNQIQHVGKMADFAISPDAKRIAFIGTNDLHNPSPGQVFIAKIDAPQARKRLPDLQAQIEALTWQSEDKLALVVHQGTESFIATHKVNSNDENNYRKLGSNLGVISKLDASANGRELALIVARPEHPKELYWYRKGNFFRVTDSNSWLAQKKLAKQSVVEFNARDGLALQGILVEPGKPFKRPWPLIIYVHGGPEAHVSNGWLDRYTRPVQYAASLGFATFLPNYRGSTARGIAFTKLGQQDYAGAEFNDLLDAKQHLVEKGWVDKARVGITGASYGGYASAWAATALSEHFKAAVATMAIGNQVSKFGSTDIPNEMYLQHARQWPWQDWLWMLSRSPIYHAQHRKTPLLLMHGKQDNRVHYSQSLELYRYLSLQGSAPIRLVLFPNEGHGFKRPAARYEYAQRLIRWMQHFVLEDGQNLPPYEVHQLIPSTD